MKRKEALAVFRELAHLHPEIAHAERVEIRKADESDEAEIRIRCGLDSHCRKVVGEFLEQRKLKMREEEGLFIIYQ